MNYNDYQNYISAETMMGPNSVRVLQELFERHAVQFSADDTVLDLGCGTGLTSLVIAKETGARVYANDLWVSAEDNSKRFEVWGIGDRVTPVCEDAIDLHFEPKQFNALFSIDSYHYFAGENGFFEKKILPFLNDGAVVMIGIPGIRNEFTSRSEELLSEWLGDEAYMFKSFTQWKDIIGSNDRIDTIETWEMDCFDKAWNEWLVTENEFAVGDKKHFETIIKPYTCFVGIYIRLK